MVQIYTGHAADIATTEASTNDHAIDLQIAGEELTAAINDLTADTGVLDELFDGREAFEKRADRARRKLERYISILGKK